MTKHRQEVSDRAGQDPVLDPGVGGGKALGTELGQFGLMWDENVDPVRLAVARRQHSNTVMGDAIGFR
jgi:hypothetical protein